MELNRDNYYTQEADMQYMSCSQYQSFCECEAQAMAKLEGRWKGEDTQAFLVGNYFHSFMEGPEAHKGFCDDHFADIYKTKTDGKTGQIEVTGKYAAYESADKMINAALRDPLIKKFYDMPGEVERIMTGTLFGVPWRIRMDKYYPDHRIILDWKTTRSIYDLIYNPVTRERETFMEAHGYLMRAAAYAEIEKQNTGKDTDPMFVIVAISKQDIPDKGIFSLNHHQRWEYEMEQIQKKLVRIQQVKEGRANPIRCGVCDYCRSTKITSGIRPYYVLKPEFKEAPEEDDLLKISAPVEL